MGRSMPHQPACVHPLTDNCTARSGAGVGSGCHKRHRPDIKRGFRFGGTDKRTTLRSPRRIVQLHQVRAQAAPTKRCYQTKLPRRPPGIVGREFNFYLGCANRSCPGQGIARPRMGYIKIVSKHRRVNGVPLRQAQLNGRTIQEEHGHSTRSKPPSIGTA